MFGDIDYFQTIPQVALRKKRRIEEVEEQKDEANKNSVTKGFDYNT